MESNRTGQPEEEIEGRRPLKSRQMPVFQKLAAWLATTSITPNMISVSSVLFACLAAAAMVATREVDHLVGHAALWVAAAAMMQGRLIANLLDGMVAVEGGKGSPVGDLYNEVPDRVSDAVIFGAAGFAAGGMPELGLLASILAVCVAYVRAIGASVGAGQIFAGPMAKPQRMAVMTGTCVLLALLKVTIDQYGQLINVALVVVAIGCIITGIRRLLMIAKHLRDRATNEDDGQQGVIQ